MSDNQLTIYTQERGLKPSFHDGLETRKTYLVVAAYGEQKAKQPYNCICIRPISGYYRVHAYPDFNHFGLTLQQSTYHRNQGDLNGLKYEGAHLQEQDILDMLGVLKYKRGVKIAKLDTVIETAKLGYHPQRAVAVAYDKAA